MSRLIPHDVEAFAERNEVGIDEDGIEMEKKIRAYQEKKGCTYDEAFSEITGTMPIENW